MLFIICIFSINLYFSYSLIYRDYPFILGSYILRSTNDPNLLNKYTYLVINNDYTIKLKTIKKKNFIAYKISRNGLIEIKNNFFENFLIKNKYNLVLNYSYVNKYSYSIFGIEIPEFRFDQNINYKNVKKIMVQQKSNSIYVLDKTLNYYYLFDSYNINPLLPFKEMTFGTLVIAQVVSFFINIFLANLLNII